MRFAPTRSLRPIAFGVLSSLLLAPAVAAQAPSPCFDIHDGVVTCDAAARPGEVEYRFRLRNLSGRPLRAIQLAPTSGAFAVEPSLIEFPPLGPDATLPVSSVRVYGTSPQGRVNLCVLGVGVDDGFCCLQGHHFEVGDCGPPTARLLAPNGFRTAPCRDPFEPGTCVQVCETYVACDDRGCHYASFTVTNRSRSVMDHVFIPDADVTPGAVRFPEPLQPGQAARVWVEICDARPGPRTLPIVLGSCRDWHCCGTGHTVELPECPCVGVRDERAAWSSGPEGALHIDYRATVDNRAPWDAGTILIAPLAPDTMRIETTRFPPEGKPLRSRTISTGIDLPPGHPGPARLLIVVHAADYSDCCLIERVIRPTDAPGEPTPITIESRPGGVALRFRAPEDELCCLQESTDLTGGNWRTIQAISGAGQEVEMEIGSDSGRPKRFFRLLTGDHVAP